MSDRDRESHTAVLDEHNRQLRDDLVPAYCQMADLFTAKLHLVEPETSSYYPTLVEFCEGWRRYLDRTVPPGVADAVMPKEERLHPFYDHVAQKTEQLRESRGPETEAAPPWRCGGTLMSVEERLRRLEADIELFVIQEQKPALTRW